VLTADDLRLLKKLRLWRLEPNPVLFKRNALALAVPVYGERWWLTSVRERSWFEQLDLLVAWRAENPGRWPSQRAFDPVERALGVWLSDQREAAGGGRSSSIFFRSGRQHMLDTEVPGWNRPRDEQWDASLQNAVAIRKKNNGRLPHANSPDTDDRVAGLWIRVQKNRASGDGVSKKLVSSGQKERLDTELPGWNDTRDEQWDASLQNAVAIRKKNNGRLPRKNALDPDEKKAGHWLISQRRAAGGGGGSIAFAAAGRLHTLDTWLPGWSDRRAKKDKEAKLDPLEFERSREASDARWHDNLKDVAAFRKNNPDSWPSKKVGSSHERRLGQWLFAQRYKANGGEGTKYFYSKGRDMLLDESVPGWR